MFIRTANLLLRPGWADDAPALAAAIASEARPFMLAPSGWPRPLDDVAAYLGRERLAHEADLLVCLRDGVVPRLIGGVGLAARTDGAVEFGAWIVPSHRGRGFATEAGRALIAAARSSLRLDRLVVADAVLPAAHRLLARLGFRDNVLDLRERLAA